MAAEAISGKRLSDGQTRYSGSTPAVSVSGWLTRSCLYCMAGSLPSTADVSIWVWGCQEVLCRASASHPSVPCYPLRLSPAVAPRPSFQRSYYSELTKQQRLGGNDGLSSGGHSSVVVTALSSGTEGLRAHSVAMVGQDLCPSKVSVEWYSHQAPAQGTTELAL
ncbi:hypothetical protein Acr_21g0000990 [Actinidia rufa]|uniref:Uncharacterized protein n=1 Tax=Actinidia rufa TaxID=165716 RepID=A0A7J0GFB5_9ERIC|nr:hypothetical protein Acr_21g0000990 [Actinidia rufa]